MHIHQVVAENKDLEDYDPADIAVALTRMVSYNISHLAYLNAKAYGIQRVFFGGFYIRGHPYTMETISYAIRFWSKARPLHLLLMNQLVAGKQSVAVASAHNFACIEEKKLFCALFGMLSASAIHQQPSVRQVLCCKQVQPV